MTPKKKAWNSLLFLLIMILKILAGGTNLWSLNTAAIFTFLIPSTKNYKKVSIQVKGDFPWAEPKWLNAAGLLTHALYLQGGKEHCFEARGEIITVPLKKGDARNITNPSRKPGA
jgi:tricorn protease